jgi:hypothetical protein
LGAVVLVVVVLIIVFSQKDSKSYGPSNQINDYGNNTLPVNPSPTDNPAASANNSSTDPANELIGTWVSADQGKGLQGTGKFVTTRATTQIDVYSDVNVVIQKVENNVAIGTLTYIDLCTTAIITPTGKTAITEQPRCTKKDSQPVELQIGDNNKLNFKGKNAIGADISFTGSYTNDAVSGTFTWASTSGEIKGTFDLVRSKN